MFFFFFSSRRRHTRLVSDWSSDVCSSDLMLVNISDYPDEGNFHTMALHRSGDVTIAVSSGGVPGAAVRIRDAIAERFDGRYERAVSALRGLRSRLIAGGEDRWRMAAPTLVGDDFCSSVEDGSFTEKLDSWR